MDELLRETYDWIKRQRKADAKGRNESDLVTGHMYVREHYISRYWCQRTLWESSWIGTSPIADPDYQPSDGEGSLPVLRGLDLPKDVLEKVYSGNARRLVGLE